MFLAAPDHEECVRVRQLGGDGGRKHSAPSPASGLRVDREFRAGESPLSQLSVILGSVARPLHVVISSGAMLPLRLTPSPNMIETVHI